MPAQRLILTSSPSLARKFERSLVSEDWIDQGFTDAHTEVGVLINALEDGEPKIDVKFDHRPFAVSEKEFYKPADQTIFASANGTRHWCTPTSDLTEHREGIAPLPGNDLRRKLRQLQAIYLMDATHTAGLFLTRSASQLGLLREISEPTYPALTDQTVILTSDLIQRARNQQTMHDDGELANHLGMTLPETRRFLATPVIRYAERRSVRQLLSILDAFNLLDFLEREANGTLPEIDQSITGAEITAAREKAFFSEADISTLIGCDVETVRTLEARMVASESKFYNRAVALLRLVDIPSSEDASNC
ncbi:MAG: hypothetical protein AAGE61_00900 [Pseudomonadota bacterium]